MAYPRKPPGLIRREREYAEALRERDEKREMAREVRGGMKLTGEVGEDLNVARARRALERQQAEYRRRGGLTNAAAHGEGVRFLATLKTKRQRKVAY